jgi:hypothetical protein
MPKYFVDSAPVAVPEWDDDPNIISDRPPNVIYILPKMSVEIKGRVSSEMFGLTKDNQMEARLGQNELALLIHNIVRWEGPDLSSVPCTRANISRLDPTEPHIARVLEEIAQRNKSPKAPKESAITNLSTKNGATDLITQEPSVSLPLGNGLPRSRLQSAITGHTSKSEP